MKTTARMISWILAVVLFLSLLPAATYAQEVTVDFDFANDLRGDGEGTLTVSGLTGTGKLFIYFADEQGVLPGYEPIAVKEYASSSAALTLPRAFLLPPAAGSIAVFADKSPAESGLSEAIAVFDIPADKRLTSGDPSLSFASVSDVHMNYDDNGYGASAKWTAALDFFDEKLMNCVIISGDLTGSGTTAEYERYRTAVEESCYDPALIYEAQGNHDATQVARFLSYTQGDDDIHPFEGSAWFYVLKPGENGARDNLFIFMAQELSSTGATPNCDNFSKKQLDWVEDLLKTYAGTNTNIFLVEHAMIRNFGPGDKVDGVYVEPMYFADRYPGNIRFKGLLNTYKEVIMMSGHTHLSLREGYNFGDENGNAARMIHNSSISQPRCYTSSGSISYDSQGRTTQTTGSEAYLVYVYGDCATYVGYDLTEKRVIPTASYLIPLYSEDRSAAQSIAVTVPPEKTEYTAGQWFDGAGMVVTATYADGTTAAVKGWGLSKFGALTTSDAEVYVTYGDCAPVRVAITVDKGPSVNGEGVLEGSGTKDDPFLIGTPEDFLTLTNCFNASTSSDEACGAGFFYKQTADIDMTGVTGYEGTHANGNAKCYFGGIYDGGGHTLTVDVSSAGQTSVFPYITGAILNLRFKGGISSDTSAQPIRTVQAGAVVANCVFEMTLTSSAGNGVCYTQYGVLLNVYVSGVGTKAVYTTNSNGKYYHVFTNMKNSSGSALTHSTTTASSDLTAICDAFNDREDEAFTAGVSALGAKCPDLGEKALGEVTVKDGKLILSGGEIGGNAPLFKGSGSAEDPIRIATSADFKLLTDFFNASASSSSAYGAGLYFKQTADIDMTGVTGYEGTHANGNAKCYFGGIYDGGGHTLTVDISSAGQTSVFPYITGAILNLRFKGGVSSDTSAQPIRTVQTGAVVANCLIDLTLTSDNANGVCYTNYGTIFAVFVQGTATHASHSSNSGKYYNVFTNVKDASGKTLTTSAATSTADLEAVRAGLSDRTSDAALGGLAALTALDPALTFDALETVSLAETGLYFGSPLTAKEDINGDGTVNISDVTDLLLYLAQSTEVNPAYDLTGDGKVTISDVTALLFYLSTN